MSNFKNVSKLLAMVMAALVMGGCATSQRLSAENKEKIKSAQISQSVEKGEVFLLAPGGAAAGMMFGAVGGLASSGAVANSQTAFVDYLNKNNISIEKIVEEEFEKSLRASGKLTIASAGDNSVPTIKLSVPQYGFGVTHLLSSNVVPVLQIKGEMFDGAGKAIWSASDRMLPSIASPMNATAWTQIANDPKQIEEQLRKAAKYLTDKLVLEL